MWPLHCMVKHGKTPMETRKFWEEIACFHNFWKSKQKPSSWEETWNQFSFKCADVMTCQVEKNNAEKSKKDPKGIPWSFFYHEMPRQKRPGSLAFFSGKILEFWAWTSTSLELMLLWILIWYFTTVSMPLGRLARSGASPVSSTTWREADGTWWLNGWRVSHVSL